MIKRIILANDILEIQYFKLLSKFQHYILECIGNDIFVNRNEKNQNIFIKKTNSKRCGKAGLIECYEYILNKYFTEDERDRLEKNLKKYNIPKNKIVYDFSTKNLEIIGCSYSKKCFSYYNGAGYSIIVDKNIPLYYNKPEKIFKKLNDIDDIVSNLPSECREYYGNNLKCIKFNDELLDEKLLQLRDFLKYLNLNVKEKSYLLGCILKDDIKNKNDSIFIEN